MAAFAAPGGGLRGDAQRRLVQAMVTHPELVAGEGRACTELMRAARGLHVENGAEAVSWGIIPERGLGIALKVTDGGTRGPRPPLPRCWCIWAFWPRATRSCKQKYLTSGTGAGWSPASCAGPAAPL